MTDEVTAGEGPAAHAAGGEDDGAGPAELSPRPARRSGRWARRGGGWARRAGGWARRRAAPAGAALLNRVASTAEQRTTPLRALGAFACVVVLTVSALAVIAAWPPSGQLGARWLSAHRGAGQPTADPTPAAGGRMLPRPIGGAPGLSPPARPPDPTGDFIGWAIMDLRTGAVTGSDNLAATSTTASMIKAWIVADYLRRTAEAGEQPSQARLDQLRLIIRDSNNEYAEQVFREVGAHESIDRLIVLCGLTDSRAVPYRWSNTQLSPRDAARMGACIADGRAAGPQWTQWLLEEMRQVRGVGDFGIRDALPPGRRGTVAIKNGWVIRDAQQAWHVNCLAIGDGWSMGVMTRYPAQLGYQYGAELCRSLAAQHLR